MGMVIKKAVPKKVEGVSKVEMETLVVDKEKFLNSGNIMPKKGTTKKVQAEFKVGKGQVTKQHPDGAETHVEELVGGEMFEYPPANVAINIGLTRNLGNFQSIKFSVSLSVPTANNEKDIGEAFAFAKEWVDSKVNAINVEVDEMVKN